MSADPAEDWIGRTIDELETPVAIIALPALERNIAELAAYGASHAIELYPHVKTHKSLQVAQRQIEAGADGLTVAKAGEAELFAALGVPLVAHYPPVGRGRAERLAAVARAVRLTVALDSTAAADLLEAALANEGATAEVLVELDVGMRRTGAPSVDSAVAIGEHVDGLRHLRLAGLSCYPGHIRRGSEFTQQLSAMNQLLVDCRSRFTAKGLRVTRISGGSTPTVRAAHNTVVTELRPGTYVFLDRGEASGALLDRCALRVMTTVISREQNRFVIDAGSKALSDAKARVPRQGSAAVLNRPELEVDALYEEHGVCTAVDGPAPKLGERLELVPNHACTCVNLHDALVGVRDGIVEEVYPVQARGRIR